MRPRTTLSCTEIDGSAELPPVFGAGVDLGAVNFVARQAMSGARELPQRPRLLLALLPLFGGRCRAARRLRLGFFAGRITLGFRFVLLGSTLPDYVITASKRSRNLLGFAFDALDDAFDGFVRPALVVPH